MTIQNSLSAIGMFGSKSGSDLGEENGRSRQGIDVTLEEQIELVCVMEATARKPGNVHPSARFDDLRYADFVRAARAVSQPLARAEEVGVGQAILDAVRATREATGTNVNLGIVLLLAPLAAVPTGTTLDAGIERVLERTTVEDAKLVYEAIRIAQPGGMGDVADQDIREQPTITLREAMKLAADRDGIAEQYANGYADVMRMRPLLTRQWQLTHDWENSLILLQLGLMQLRPDTLITRKCGLEVSKEASKRAMECIDQTKELLTTDPVKLAAFDRWLRADGHRRNPGTTADMVAAILFAAVRDRLISLPALEEVNEFAATIQASV